MEEHSLTDRFDAPMDRFQLAQTATLIVRHAGENAGIEIDEVTQRAYDAARVDAGFPGSPQARSVCSRLGYSWRQVLEMSAEGRCLSRTMGARERQAYPYQLSDETVSWAMRHIAVWLEAETIAPADYDRARKEITAGQTRASSGQPIALPTSNQISTYAKGWDAALRIAGLEPKPDPGSREGLGLSEACELCIRHTGARPSARLLDRWAAANGFSVRRGKFAPALEAAIARLGEEGIVVPARPPRRSQRGVFSEVADGLAAPIRRQRRWSKEGCLDALREFLGSLSPSERPTQKRYREFQRGRPDLPAASAFGRHGGLGALLKEAAAT